MRRGGGTAGKNLLFHLLEGGEGGEREDFVFLLLGTGSLFRGDEMKQNKDRMMGWGGIRWDGHHANANPWTGVLVYSIPVPYLSCQVPS